MRIHAKPWTISCLKETRAFSRAKPNTFQKNTVTLIDLEERKTRYQKPLTHKSFVTKSLRVDRKHLSLTSGKVTQGPAVRWMLWTRQRAIFAIFNNRTFKVPQRFDPVQQQMRSDSLYAWLHHGKDRGETNNHFGKYFIDPIVLLGWYYDKTYQIWRGPRYICENIHLFFCRKIKPVTRWHYHQIKKQTKGKTTSFKMGFTARVFIRSGEASQSPYLRWVVNYS